MIHHLKGRLVELYPTYVVIDCNGVGYSVHISLNTYSNLSGKEQITLLTYPIYKEDSQTLYGFAERIEREVFALLISVSGVGANTARVILSGLSPDEVSACIAREDVGMLKSIKGIGAKTAERIIVDLKDKIGSIDSSLQEGVVGKTSVINEASAALEVLGYSPKTTGKLLNAILKDEPGIELEGLIKVALKKL